MTGEGRRQATDFKEAVRCPSAIIQQKALQKTVCAREVPGVTGTLNSSLFHQLMISGFQCLPQIFLN